MQITLRVVKLLVCLFAFFGLVNFSFSKEELSANVAISSGRKVAFIQGKILVVGAGIKQTVELPSSLKRALRASSEVVFPESASRRLEGRDVVLLVVGMPSSKFPNGYCGAGSEDKLYAIELSGRYARVVFSIEANSCLNNIELNANGVESPFKSIKWVGDPARISISWLSDQSGQERVHMYKMVQGRFVESSVGKN